MSRRLPVLLAIILLFVGLAQPLAFTKELTLLPHHHVDSRTLRILNSGNMRYFLNTLESAFQNSLGLAPESLSALYKHALTLLTNSRDSNSPSSTFGFSLGHLSLTLATTNDAPIPWDTALQFARNMHESATRGLLGVEYQALVFDLALDVTMQVTLRLLFDKPLRPIQKG
ncbi:MAG: hypothetical protein L6R40_006140 [Gallowayella cf. fulva]|nr:MAG: hypothetical protein L6R40_006140 [Xanthomendoza cf. fulva]